MSPEMADPRIQALRRLERALACVGLVCIGAWAAACAQGSLYQWDASRSFDAALRARLQAEQHDTSQWSEERKRRFAEAAGAPVEVMARLEIPAAGVSVMVLPGTAPETLDRAVGHIEGTVRPGEAGNVGIAGHRDGFFRGLRHLAPGDPMRLTTFEGVTHYAVERVEVVEPTAVEVLAPREQDALTLVTCFPFYYVGDAPQRFIVHGRKLRFETHAALGDGR